MPVLYTRISEVHCQQRHMSYVLHTLHLTECYHDNLLRNAAAAKRQTPHSTPQLPTNIFSLFSSQNVYVLEYNSRHKDFLGNSAFPRERKNIAHYATKNTKHCIVRES